MFSAAAARRGASSSRSSCRRSTQRPDARPYPRAARLSRGADLERIRREGKALRTNGLLVRVSASPLAYLRVGIVVPRYGHSAVDRNRLKRRLRELVRLHLLPLPASADLVIWAQREAYTASFANLKHSMGELVPRILRQIGRGG